MSEFFGTRQKQSLAVLLFLLAGMIYVSWRNQPRTPEGQVEAAVRELVAAAEKKDMRPFRKWMGTRVRDDSGRTRDEILSILRGIFFRHPKISLQILSLDVQTGTNDTIVNAKLQLFMSESLLPQDKGTFDLAFKQEDGAWRIWEIKWLGGYGY